MFKNKTIFLMFFGSFCLVFVFTLKAKANLFGEYVSRDTERVDQKRTVGSGSRSGECQSEIGKNEVSLLVPKQEVVHYTSLASPSFFITNRNTSVNKVFRFTLIDPEKGMTLVEQKIAISEGIERIKLPESVSLEIGRTYIWHIAIPCTNNEERYQQVLRAAVKRSELSQNVQTQLDRSHSNLKTAAIYAQNGFWYDALEIAIEEQNRKPSYLDRLLSSAEINL